MAVSQVIRVQAAPGRFPELLERSQQLQKIRDRLAPGIKTRRFIPATGTVTGALIVVLEYPDMKAFGELNEKLQSDPEARALRQSMLSDKNPAAVSQSIELVREL